MLGFASDSAFEVKQGLQFDREMVQELLFGRLCMAWERLSCGRSRSRMLVCSEDSGVSAILALTAIQEITRAAASLDITEGPVYPFFLNKWNPSNRLKEQAHA